MNNDSYLTIFISIIIILNVINVLPKTHIRNKPYLLHFAILLCIVLLFYVKYEKSAFMISLLYLIIYLQSPIIKEYYSTKDMPSHSYTQSTNPQDVDAVNLITSNKLPTQITAWFAGDTFDVDKNQWRDIGNNNHINFTSPNIKVNSGVLIPLMDDDKDKATTNPKVQKWVSGGTDTQFSIPLKVSADSSITFVHLTRYSPRTINRGKLWTNESGIWISGYDDNKFTTTDTNARNLSSISSSKNGDIMNIRGSNWNLFIDTMDMSKKTRTVSINNNEYIFETTELDSIPNKIGINIHNYELSDWDCAEIMVYNRILSKDEIQQIINYLNNKYSNNNKNSITFPPRIVNNEYNIYNHYDFISTADSDWKSPPTINSSTSSGNKLLGISDTEYECVYLCNKNKCDAFSYDMEKGTCYSVDVKNVLNHTKPSKSILSGTNKKTEEKAIRAKEEAERKAREEEERKAREEADRKAREEEERRRISSHTFTPAGASGSHGPSLSQLYAAYPSAIHPYLSMTKAGFQEFTIPISGIYKFIVVGAHGSVGIIGTPSHVRGGRGAYVVGNIRLDKGTVLSIIVGQAGSYNYSHGGGGGASLVFNKSTGDLLFVAGGGGGCRAYTWYSGLDGSNNNSGTCASQGYDQSSTRHYNVYHWYGGRIASMGYGGVANSTWGDGGAGLFGNGEDDGCPDSFAAQSLYGSAIGGGNGADASSGGSSSSGGFGGGGAGGGCWGGGGGGGYTGGNGGFIGGGGGSFFNTSRVTDGSIVIDEARSYPVNSGSPPHGYVAFNLLSIIR